MVDAALSGLGGREIGVIESLMQGSTGTPQRDAAVTMLAATIVRGAQDAAVQRLFQLAAQVDRPEWQRSAILRGAEVSLMSVPDAGDAAATAARRRAKSLDHGGSDRDRGAARAERPRFRRAQAPPRPRQAKAPREDEAPGDVALRRSSFSRSRPSSPSTRATGTIFASAWPRC